MSVGGAVLELEGAGQTTLEERERSFPSSSVEWAVAATDAPLRSPHLAEATILLSGALSEPWRLAAAMLARSIPSRWSLELLTSVLSPRDKAVRSD